MNIRIFDNISDPFLKSEWGRLEREADVFPQSTYHWCATWWKHLGGRRKLHVVMAVDDTGQAISLTPLCLETGIFGPILRSFPVNYGDFFNIIMSPEFKKEQTFDVVYKYLLSFRQWNAALLVPINDASDLFASLKEERVPNRVFVGNIVTDISSKNWDEYQRMLSKNRRNLTRKKMRRLERDHDVQVEIVDDESGFLSYFDRICEIQRLRATKDRLDRSGSYLACVKETSCYLFRRGEMVLYLVKAGGRVIAYRLGLIRGTTFFDWNTNYDIEWSVYSPGLISLGYVIRDLIGKGFTTVDLMAGVYDYKLSFSPKHEIRKNYLFVMGNSSPRSMMFEKYQLEWRERIRPYYRKVLDSMSNRKAHFRI